MHGMYSTFTCQVSVPGDKGCRRARHSVMLRAFRLPALRASRRESWSVFQAIALVRLVPAAMHAEAGTKTS